jgi:hypothetical protein
MGRSGLGIGVWDLCTLEAKHAGCLRAAQAALSGAGLRSGLMALLKRGRLRSGFAVPGRGLPRPRQARGV